MSPNTGLITRSGPHRVPDCAEWDHQHLHATLVKAQGGVVVFPDGWSSVEVFDDWTSTQRFLAPVEAMLARWRDGSATRGDYRLRQAYLSHALLAHPLWQPGTRLAACYATILIGMNEHGFRLDRRSEDAAQLSHYPELVLGVDKTFEELYQLLLRAYADPAASIRHDHAPRVRPILTR